MARGGRFGLKREGRNNIPLSRKGSDESDEDYMVGEDEEFNETEDEDCSLTEDETDDSFGEFVAEEDEEEEEEVRMKKKVGKSGGGKCFQVRKKNGIAKGRAKKVAYRAEEEEDYNDDDDDDGDFFVSQPKRKHKLSCQEEEDDDVEDLYHQEPNDFDVKIPRKSIENKNGGYKKKPRKRTKVSYQEDEEEGDYDDSYDDDDEEFTPDEVDGFDEEELSVTKNNKVGRIRVQEIQITGGKRRKRNTEVLKKSNRKEPMIEKSLRKRSRSDHGEFVVNNPVSLRKKKAPKSVRGRRRKPSLDFDSDFVSSGSIDFEYTVSEEEREQVREASEYCGSVATSLRSSNALKMIKKEEFLPLQRKCLGRKKGKEKAVDMNVAVGKQVCGICLSEEGKRTVRGILNCCSHYFCFTCIMEWSKVESRCPLCKQRFATVCITARDDGGHDLRDSVIQVPERDQVYQPSEEELRGYLDPYENVLCTECLQGGDDALMLLCDICDSPAHSYCVGLGREVPEGNWYCDCCRPIALASLNTPHLNPTPDLGAGITSPIATVRETFDLNELYVPETPQTQVAISSPSPRHSIGDTRATSPGSGSGAFTLFERRRIQRQIHQLLNNRNNGNRGLEGDDNVSPVTAISLFGSRITRDGVLAPQHMVTLSRMAPQNTHGPGRLSDNSMPLLYRREVMSPRLSSLRGHVLHNQASTSTNHIFDGLAHTEFVGINERIGREMSHQLLNPCSGTSNTGSDAGVSTFRFRETVVPSRTLQGPLHTSF